MRTKSNKKDQNQTWDQKARDVAINTQIKLIKKQLESFNLKIGESMSWSDWEGMPKEFHELQSRLWYLGAAKFNSKMRID